MLKLSIIAVLFLSSIQAFSAPRQVIELPPIDIVANVNSLNK